MSHNIARLFVATIGMASFAPLLALASVSPSIIPTAVGTYSEWSPSTGTTHYTLVDEAVCNGVTDYVATSTLAKRDSFAIALSSVPNGAVITAIAVTPCASRASIGSGSSVLNVFYRYGGANGTDKGAYAPSGTTPTALATSTWSSLLLTKTSTSTLEIGMVYTSGTKGGRLSRIAAQLTYGLLPSATTSAASSVTTTSALLNGIGNPNGSSTTAWFRIATLSPGTCNDTFGTRVPLSGSTSLGAGVSAVPYSTSTGTLIPSTTYYYCAIGSNPMGKSFGTVQSFTTLSVGVVPSVTTTAATSITDTSALMNGTGNPNGSSTTAWFRIDTASPGTCNDTFGTRVPVSGGTSLGAGTSSAPFSLATGTLTQNTTYYYCAVAQNGVGKGYGTPQSFTTLTTAIGITNINSSISTSTTWTTSGGTYVVDGAINIDAGITVNINPGVVVKFKTAASNLIVNGTLSAIGSPSSRIYFTSYADDTVNGDTNGDTNSSSPAAGDWGKIEVPAGGVVTMQNANIRYGGWGDYVACAGSMLCNSGGTLTILDSIISTSKAIAVLNSGVSSGTTTITGTTQTASQINASTFGIAHYGGTISVGTSTIGDNTYCGIYSTSGSLNFNSNIFSSNGVNSMHNGGGAVCGVADEVRLTHSDNIAVGGGIGGIYVSSFNVTKTLQADPLLPYIIYGELSVATGVTLTIAPGAVLKFKPSSSIIVNGTLVADSAASSSKIYFTSFRDDIVGGDTNEGWDSLLPAAGDWGGIKVNAGGSATLNFISARYGGSSVDVSTLFNNGGTLAVSNTEVATSTTYGVYNAAGTTTIANSTIHHSDTGVFLSYGSLTLATSTVRDNTSYGARFGTSSPAVFTMNGNTFSNNTSGVALYDLANVIDFTHSGNIVSGSGMKGLVLSLSPYFTNVTLPADLTLIADAFAYIIPGALTVPAGTTLTIKPGVVMKFNGSMAGLTVEGTLVATGIPDDHVYLTSIKDDRVPMFGDTNGDGIVTTPAASNWDSVKVNTGGSATFSYTDFRYGGYSTSKMLYNNSGILTIDNSEVAYSGTGIYTTPGSALTISSTTIAHNVYGIYHDGGITTLSDLGNIIENNTTYGLFNGTMATITATMIYWPSTTTAGTSTGPYHPIYNSVGNGDAISNYINWSPSVGMRHFMLEIYPGFPETTSVNSNNELRWKWTQGSLQTTATQLNSALATWSARGSVSIMSTSTGVTANMFEENDSKQDWSGQYIAGATSSLIEINMGKLFDNTSAEIQNTWTHELGHALGLGHSYVDNVLYYINSPQTTLGTQDILDYNYCWVTGQGNCLRY